MAFPNESAYDEFIELVSTEQGFQNIANRVLAQSATYERQAAAGALPTGKTEIVNRVVKWAMAKMNQDPQIVVDELGKVYWELGPDALEQAFRRSGLSARATSNVIERARGAAAALGAQGLVSVQAQ